MYNQETVYYSCRRDLLIYLYKGPTKRILYDRFAVGDHIIKAASGIELLTY